MRRTIPFLAGLLSAAYVFAQGPVIVPDRFVRGWDPVTVRYAEALGPEAGGALPGPTDFLSVSPGVDGEYRWEDARTVRFLPSESWPPLKTFTVKARGASFALSSMIAPPGDLSPAPGSANLEPFSSIILSFPAPLGADNLKRMLRLELRELPGVSAEGAQWLRDSDFSVAELEAGKGPTRVSYRVSLAKSVGYGKRLLLHVLLSPDPALPDSLADYSWETKPAFRLVAVGDAQTSLPVSSSGAAYGPEQALNSRAGGGLFLEFSDALGALKVEDLKRLVSFSPAVRNLKFEVSGRRLRLSFDADRDRVYKVEASPGGVLSAAGRTVESGAKASFHFYIKQAEAFIAWKAAEGLMERYGPRSFPMESRGVGRLDLRIQKIDPLSWDYAPFPRSPVAVDEAARPPMSGEEPAPGTDIAGHIRLLPSPPVSKIVDLPVGTSSPRTLWGLDLGKEFDAAFGKDAPGTYLAGYRVLDRSSARYWVRVQVTDLCLSGAEEERAVQFYVTSLRDASAAADAEVRLEARVDGKTVVLASGRTDKTGSFRLEHRTALQAAPERVVVEKGGDVLVVRTDAPPPAFANNHWSRSGSWLSWLASTPRSEREAPRRKGWISTERPVYRPGEAVHVFGWARDWRLGRIERYSGGDLAAYVSGPDDKSWTLPAKLDGAGSFAVDFKEEDLPTGEYRAALATQDGTVLSEAPFKILAYRVPLFQVDITGPDSAPLDKPFEVLLTANYYSGGRVSGADLVWQIEQYPWSVRPASWPGFVFSTDERFSSASRGESAEAGTREAKLDKDGSARLLLDPRNERDGRARRYVVTGTVRGADRQTVVQSKSVYALPPFSLGVKTERLQRGGKTVSAQILALDHAEKPLADKVLTVRLIQRQWHSYVAETDFSTGDAKYVSESVDTVLAERSVVSGLVPTAVDFEVKEGGVYLVEVSARDYLGRRVWASADLFLAADGPVSWERKPAGLFEMVADKDAYQAGDTARLVIKSPFRDGWVLLATEAPDGNVYSLVPVKEGRGIAELPIDGTMVPSLNVQALLYRGRVAGAPAPAAGSADLAKPASLGASAVLKVLPTVNQVQVSLDHQAKASPGSRVNLRLSARDDQGRKVDGEAVVWLVDKAVLSLGAERALDPLPTFIDRLASAVRLSDTRNLVLGLLPMAEVPGGDGSDEVFAGDLFNRSTVRRNFKTVPFFKAGIPVRAGEASLDVDLPDNLTDFAVRAVVAAGQDRFGAARSVLPVRLDLSLQNIAPRFVRPGDAFVAGGTARATDDKGGPSVWTFRLQGLASSEEQGKIRPFVLPSRDAVPLMLRLSAPASLPEGEGGAVLSLAAERGADKARDAFELDLPVRPDARDRVESAFLDLSPGSAALPPPALAAREGSLKRSVLVAQDGRLLALARGFSFLRDYPYGCLEQRTSKLYPAVALASFVDGLGLGTPKASLNAAFAEYRRYLASCQDEDTGLFSYWPKSEPSVSLTAYVVEFLDAAAKAGWKLDRKVLDRAEDGLSAALRSDSGLWEENWADFERVQAFASLEGAGRWEASYAADFVSRSDGLDLCSRAKLYMALKKRNALKGAKASALEKGLWDSLVVKKEKGKDTLAGVKAFAGSGRVLLTETRAVAAALEALSLASKNDKRLDLLADWLIERAGPQGWASTMDTVAAARALSAYLDKKAGEDLVLEFSSGAKTEKRAAKGARAAAFDLDGWVSGTVKLPKGTSAKNLAVLVTTRYRPAAAGSALPGANAGFLVQRDFLPLGPGGLGKAVPAKAGTRAVFPLDQVVEEHLTLTSFQDQDFVALEVPLAAGFEPLDPGLAGAGPEATPSNGNSLRPSYQQSLDDRVVYYFKRLPKGTHHFFFRERASFEGSFTAPQARAELMYDQGVYGLSDGVQVDVEGQGGK